MDRDDALRRERFLKTGKGKRYLCRSNYPWLGEVAMHCAKLERHLKNRLGKFLLNWRSKLERH